MTNKNENLEAGFVLMDKVDVIKSDSEKEKMANSKTDHSIDQMGRYKFYADKRATKKHPMLIDKEGAGMLFCKLNVLTAETPDVTSEQR